MNNIAIIHSVVYSYQTGWGSIATRSSNNTRRPYSSNW